MRQRIAIAVFLFNLMTIGVWGQKFPREYWKEIAEDSSAIVLGIAEEDYRVIRPEKWGLNSDGSAPSEREIYAGRVFRIKVVKKLKGIIKPEKVGEEKYINVFLNWVSGVPSWSEPVIFSGNEYVLFLKANNDKELEGKETIAFRPNAEIVRKAFDYKSSYLIAHSFRGAVLVKPEGKNELIKEIKAAID